VLLDRHWRSLPEEWRRLKSATPSAPILRSSARCAAIWIGHVLVPCGICELARPFRQTLFAGFLFGRIVELAPVTPVTLESEFADLLKLVANERDRALVARYFGWDGQGIRTLQLVGDDFRMTRERVRQICSGTLSELKGANPCTPVLGKVLAFIEQHLPAPVADIESRLCASGLTAAMFRLEGIIHAAEIFGRKPEVAIRNTTGGRIALPREAAQSASLILEVARRTVRHCGAATISDVLANLRSAGSRNSDQIIVRMLGTQADFRWLDESGGWFWFYPTTNNRLLVRIRKVMAVARRINVSELHRAVSSDRRLQGSCPPKRVLLALCAQLSWCHIESESCIVATPPPPVEEVLSKSERSLVQILENHGDAILARDLKGFCAREGIDQSTLWYLVSSSPIIVRRAYGVYVLVGVSTDSGVIESLLPPLRRTSVLLDYGWHTDGQLWLGFKLSQGMIRNGVFGVPTAMRRFLHGEYALLASDESKIGTLVMTDNAAWGLGPFFRRRCEPGQLLVIRFNLTSHVARLHLEGEDLLDEFRSLRARHVP